VARVPASPSRRPPIASNASGVPPRRVSPGGPAEPVELLLEVTPAGPFRLGRRSGMDGVLRCRNGVLERLLHHGDEPVRVRVAQASSGEVLFAASASSQAAAHHGIERMRFALGVDDDLNDFQRRFADDPLIGRSVRARPWLRVRRRPEPFEALAWAICEQLIEYERAAAIQRRVVRTFGPRCPDGSGLRDVPAPRALAAAAPAKLQSLDLGGARARTLVRTAREVALGRVDLHDEDPRRAWRRLRAIAGIGPWTVEMLALRGQGRHDQLPAADVGLLKYVGRKLSGGDPRARADEAQVRDFFARYSGWAGLAAVHLGVL
jgi:3-methyladenine DNA glycosylase/8-oxoguanine DNA glycosylase